MKSSESSRLAFGESFLWLLLHKKPWFMNGSLVFNQALSLKSQIFDL